MRENETPKQRQAKLREQAEQVAHEIEAPHQSRTHQYRHTTNSTSDLLMRTIAAVLINASQARQQLHRPLTL